MSLSIQSSHGISCVSGFGHCIKSSTVIRKPGLNPGSINAILQQMSHSQVSLAQVKCSQASWAARKGHQFATLEKLSKPTHLLDWSLCKTLVTWWSWSGNITQCSINSTHSTLFLYLLPFPCYPQETISFPNSALQQTSWALLFKLDRLLIGTIQIF